jgi:UDP-N-acetylmuramoylalanine--D-glutamate ligase
MNNPNHYLIAGLGKTGQSVVDFFNDTGQSYVIFDDKVSPRVDWTSVSRIVVSPGLPFNHPILEEGRNRSIPIISDIDIFFEHKKHQSLTIGITGTNGKSTTTTLIHHLIDGSSMGGNIGIPCLSMNPSHTYVLELSSFQLYLSKPLPLDVAIFLNLTPDHLDKHKTVEAYQKSKEKICDIAKHRIVVIDHDIGLHLKNRYPNAMSVSTKNIGADLCLLDEYIVYKGISYPYICPLGTARHQRENIAAAVAAVLRHSGENIQKIIEKLSTYTGLPHRQEIVYQDTKMIVVNDSKATNGTSASIALNSFLGYKIFWIIGGIAKDQGITPCLPLPSSVQCSYVFGQDALMLSDQLKNYPHHVFETMEEATQAAFLDASQFKNTLCCCLLLSPACASLDQFKNFEHRGDVFKHLVSTYV